MVIENNNVNKEKYNEQAQQSVAVSVNASTASEAPKIIDKDKLENNLISKIFKISFTAKEDYYELASLKAQYDSLEKPLLFRLDELDEYMIEIINHSEINSNIIENFLMFYSRAYTMINVKHREELDKKYEIIRKSISSYLGIIISTPENFGLQINDQVLIKNFTAFYNESEKEEFDYLISDIVSSLADDYEGLKKIFAYYIFGIFHEMNINSQANFYQNDKIKATISVVIRMLNDHPVLRKLYTQSNFFRPQQLNAKMLQGSSLLGYYFNLISFECPNQTLIKTAFSSVEMVMPRC